MIELKKVLESLDINHEQLICLSILVGTDYNPKGVHGIGPKNALKLVKLHRKPEELFKEVAKTKPFDFEWQKIFQLFESPSVTKKYDLKFKVIDEKKVIKILCDDHDFSEERIESQFEKFRDVIEKNKQKTLF